MVFYPPAWVPAMPIEPPDSISIADFMSDDRYGRYPIDKSRNPFTCGLTGKTYSAIEVVEREKSMARAIFKRLSLNDTNSVWDTVVALFSLNT
ncbi:hypothetical protein FDECE_15154, partial [Fusarium decemcellulare]